MEARLTDRRINLKQLVERLKFLGRQTFDERNLCAAASYGASRKPQSLDGLHRRQQCSAFSQRRNNRIQNRNATVRYRSRLNC